MAAINDIVSVSFLALGIVTAVGICRIFKDEIADIFSDEGFDEE